MKYALGMPAGRRLGPATARERRRRSHMYDRRRVMCDVSTFVVALARSG